MWYNSIRFQMPERFDILMWIRINEKKRPVRSTELYLAVWKDFNGNIIEHLQVVPSVLAQ